MFSDKVLSFYRSLRIDVALPKGIKVMNPYLDAYTFGLCEEFYRKYYNDQDSRTLLLGINPGRFGSGTTGISFTDPIKLEKVCGIQNKLSKKPELSADFIYKMIAAFGGTEEFYAKHFISAVSPLGFTKGGKNINYYDDRKLEKAITPFIVASLSGIISMGINRKKCFCIGEGENFKFLRKLNKEQKWFDEIVPLPHPRFIMQYRRKKLAHYLNEYVTKLNS